MRSKCRAYIRRFDRNYIRGYKPIESLHILEKNGYRLKIRLDFIANGLIFSLIRDMIKRMQKEGEAMAVSYKKLFHLMIDKGMTNAELMEKGGFSANIITRLKRDNYIALESIERICRALNCGVDDILEFSDDEERTENT